MWLNFYDYKFQRDLRPVLDRIEAKGCIETKEELIAYNTAKGKTLDITEMAKVKVKSGTEVEDRKEGDQNQLPVPFDIEDIWYLSQFTPIDQTAAIRYRYNNQLAKISLEKMAAGKEAVKRAKTTGLKDQNGNPLEGTELENALERLHEDAGCKKIQEMLKDPKQGWQFLMCPKAKRHYFVWTGGVRVFCKLDAMPNEEHFRKAQGTQEDKDAYSKVSRPTSYPNNGQLGFNLNDPKYLAVVSPEAGHYTHGTEEAENFLRHAIESESGPFEFDNFTGLGTAKGNDRASEAINDFRRYNSIGWSAMSKPFSGNYDQRPEVQAERKNFLTAPIRKIINQCLPVRNKDDITRYVMNNPIIGNNARLAALQALDEDFLNKYGLTKENAENCQPIDSMLYRVDAREAAPGCHEEGDAGVLIIPYVVRGSDGPVVEEASAYIPFMMPWRITNATDNNKVDPHPRDILPDSEPREIEGEDGKRRRESEADYKEYLKEYMARPVVDKIASVRLGLANPEQFKKEVEETTWSDSRDAIHACIEAKKRSDSALEVAGWKLAAVWARLEIQQLAGQIFSRERKFASTEEFVKVAKAYLNGQDGKGGLTNYRNEILSSCVTGDLYDCNIHRMQKRIRKDTYRWWGGRGKPFMVNKQAAGTVHATQEIINKWNNELVNFFSIDTKLSRPTEDMYAVRRHPIEKEQLDIQKIQAEIEEVQAKNQKLLAQKLLIDDKKIDQGIIHEIQARLDRKKIPATASNNTGRITPGGQAIPSNAITITSKTAGKSIVPKLKDITAIVTTVLRAYNLGTTEKGMGGHEVSYNEQGDYINYFGFYVIIKSKDGSIRKVAKRTSDYHRIVIEIGNNDQLKSDLKIQLGGKLAPSPVAQGIKAILNGMKRSGDDVLMRKSIILQTCLDWLIRGATYRVVKHLGEAPFLNFKEAEDMFEAALEKIQAGENAEDEMSRAYDELHGKLTAFRKAIWKEAAQYTKEIAQLHLGVATRKQARRGNVDQSIDKENPDGESQGGDSLEIVQGADERRRQAGGRFGEEVDEEDVVTKATKAIDVLIRRVPYMNNPAVQRQIKEKIADPQRQAEEKQRLEKVNFVERAALCNVEQIAIVFNVFESQLMAQISAKEKADNKISPNTLFDDLPEEIQDKILSQVDERMSAFAQSVKAVKAEASQKGDDEEDDDEPHVLKQGGVVRSPEETIATLEGKYAEIQDAWANPNSLYYPFNNPKKGTPLYGFPAKTYEALQDLDEYISGIRHPQVKAALDKVKVLSDRPRWCPNSSWRASLFAQGALLDPDVLMRVGEPKNPIEQVIQTAAGGNGTFEGAKAAILSPNPNFGTGTYGKDPIPKETMKQVLAALEKYKSKGWAAYRAMRLAREAGGQV